MDSCFRRNDSLFGEKLNHGIVIPVCIKDML